MRFIFFKELDRRMKISNIISLLIIVSGVFLISFGIWNAGLPLGDEAGFIESAKQLASGGKYTSNLYVLAYILIFKFCPDPVSAHYICRFCASLLSTVLIYFLLKSMKFAKSEPVILLVCIFWANCHLNIPYVQYGNINIFTLNIALIGIIYLIRNHSLSAFLLCFTCFVWCAKIRPEYWLAVFLLSSYFTYLYLHEILKTDRLKIISYLKHAFLAIMILLFSIMIISTDKSVPRNFDKYLLQCFSQCYTHMYAKMNPDVKLNIMMEYSTIIDEVFDKPTGFIDAAMKNPAEIVRYFAVNGCVNSILLVPSLFQHRRIIPYKGVSEMLEIFLVLAIPIFISLLAIIKAFKSVRSFGMGGIFHMQLSDIANRFPLRPFLTSRMDMALLVILSAVSIVSIFLQIPDSRYWATCIPLSLLWMCWGYSWLFSKIKPVHLQFAIFAILMIYMSRPMFLNLKSNKIVVEKIREHNSKFKIDIPSVVGHTAFGTYAFKEFRALSVNYLTPDSFEKGCFDFFIFDQVIANSIFWENNKKLLSDFISNPGKFGYSMIYVYNEGDDFIAAYGKTKGE